MFAHVIQITWPWGIPPLSREKLETYQSSPYQFSLKFHTVMTTAYLGLMFSDVIKHGFRKTLFHNINSQTCYTGVVTVNPFVTKPSFTD